MRAFTIQADGHTAPSPFGPVERVTVEAVDGKPATWGEIWQAFVEEFPDRWAFEWFPPRGREVDEVDRYHLWMLPEGTEPTGCVLGGSR